MIRSSSRQSVNHQSTYVTREKEDLLSYQVGKSLFTDAIYTQMERTGTSELA